MHCMGNNAHAKPHVDCSILIYLPYLNWHVYSHSVSVGVIRNASIEVLLYVAMLFNCLIYCDISMYKLQ